MKRVYGAANLPEAHIVRNLLADRGIRAQVFNANASSLAGQLPIEASLPQVWVESADDAPRARELIDAFFSQSATGPARPCPACGEVNPPAFDLCWSCGAGLEQ
jgi:hypothetical protein